MGGTSLYALTCEYPPPGPHPPPYFMHEEQPKSTTLQNSFEGKCQSIHKLKWEHIPLKITITSLLSCFWLVHVKKGVRDKIGRHIFLEFLVTHAYTCSDECPEVPKFVCFFNYEDGG